MDDQEQSLWESHPFFWKYFYWLVILYLLFTIILIFAIWIPILLIVSLIAYGVLAFPLFLQFYRWKKIYYKITEKRVVIKIGIFNVNEKSIMIDKIEHFDVKRSLIDRIFNTGDIIFHTESETTPEAILGDVPRIRTVEEILTDLLSRH